MEYLTPELMLVGSAGSMVLGEPPLGIDNDGKVDEHPPEGIVAGLDD